MSPIWLSIDDEVNARPIACPISKIWRSDRAHTGRLTRGRTPESVIGKAKVWS